MDAILHGILSALYMALAMFWEVLCGRSVLLRRQYGQPRIKFFRLWELILADIAEAKFIELTVRQLMQSIDHVVVTAFKS